MAAKNWLLKMENLLRALECANAQKVVYATFALQGSAEEWWTSTERLLRMELGKNTPITWEKFKEVFNETYFPDVVRDRKAREFSYLVHGTMTIEEYATKFVELSCFAPYLISDEPKKVSKFQKDFNDRICAHIIASRVGTFTETMKWSMRLEEDFKCNPSSKEDEKNQEPSGFLHVEVGGKIPRRGSLRSPVMRVIIMGKARVPLFSLVRSGLELVVVRPVKVNLVFWEPSYATLVSNSNTLLENT